MNYAWGSIGWFFDRIDRDRLFDAKKRVRDLSRSILNDHEKALEDAIRCSDPYKIGFYTAKYNQMIIEVYRQDAILQESENRRAKWFGYQPRIWKHSIETPAAINEALNTLPGTNNNINVA